MKTALWAIAALAAIASPALADPKGDCASRDVNRRLAGCGKLIEESSLSAQDMAFAYINRGDAYFAKGEIYLAIDDFGNAIKLDPDDAKAYNNRAWAYLTAKRPKDALSDAQKAVEIEAKNALAWDTLGTIYIMLDQKEKAILALRKALALDPNHKIGREQLIILNALPKPE